MPELPEVESIAQALKSEIVGQKVSQFALYQPLILRGPYLGCGKKVSKLLKDKEITGVVRRAKRLIITISGSLALVVQLGMTGRFLLEKDRKKVEKHTHFSVFVEKNVVLHFIDPRRFGRLWIIDFADDDVENSMLEAGMTRLGAEPFGLTAKKFHPLLGSGRAIKTLLLDQMRIAGLGNIYADESLFMSGIHPNRVANRISVAESSALLRAIKRVLKKSIASGGTTFSDFKNPYGDMGEFFKMVQVYQRSGQPCRRCGSLIEKFTLTGRTTHFCPTCQPG